MAIAELRLFGGFELRRANGEVVDLPGQKDRALIAILALRSGASQSRDKLASLLWSEHRDKQARDSLKHSLNRLRPSFCSATSPMIVADRHCVTLDPTAVTVDVAVFEQLVSDGMPEALERAVALYQGDLLDGFAIQDSGFEDWLVGERQRLRNSVEEALAKLMEQSMATGATDRAAKAARRLLLLDPLREAACRTLMKVEVDHGQTSQALKIYETLRNKLHRELGVKPEPATTQLCDEIRLRRASVKLPPADSSLAQSASRAMPMHAKSSSQSKPLIAVLSFQNLSGDPEQEYFADGIAEDVMTDLSKVSALNVLSRNTIFSLKGKPESTPITASQSSVDFVVEGSVRKAEGRVRISAQLVDAVSGSHVWVERYDRDLKHIFALQEEISQAIVAALKIKLLPAEKKAIEARSTKHSEAYELYLLGRYHYSKFGIKSIEIAVHFCRRALEIDPNYARAWALLAICQERLLVRGRSEETGLPAAERALALDPSLAEAHAAKGWILMKLARYDEALAAHAESLQLEPNSYDVRLHFGMTCFQLGRHEAAIEHYERAAQLLETDFLALTNVTMNYEALGRHEELISAVRRALQRIEREIEAHPDNATALALGAILLVQLGEKDRAKQWVLRALANEPDDPGVQYNVGGAFARMSEPEQALDLLESCVPKMAPGHLNWMKKDSDLIPLHHHPRYQALIARAEARLAAFLIGQAAKVD